MDLDHPAPFLVVHAARHAERAARPPEDLARHRDEMILQPGRQLADAGVVAEDVDRSPLRRDAREQRVDLGTVGDVCAVPARRPAAGHDRPRHALRPLPVQIDHGDAGALGRKPLDDRAADARGTARDHGDASPERVHGRFLYKGRRIMSTPARRARERRPPMLSS